MFHFSVYTHTQSMFVYICNIHLLSKLYFKNVHVFIGHSYLLRKYHNSQRMQLATPLVPLSSSACALIVNRKQAMFLCTLHLQVSPVFTLGFIVITMPFLNPISIPTVKHVGAFKILYQAI